jgi:hypothetical protein
MVFALPENSVIKMKLCGRQARRQKLMPPRRSGNRPIPPTVRANSGVNEPYDVEDHHFVTLRAFSPPALTYNTKFIRRNTNLLPRLSYFTHIETLFLRAKGSNTCGDTLIFLSLHYFELVPIIASREILTPLQSLTGRYRSLPSGQHD